MKKDIEIPQVEGVYVAAVREENKAFRSQDWNAYLINDRMEPIEMVLIIARGYDGKDLTSTMRHSIKVLPAKSYAKIEFMQDEVLKLNNEFLVTFFEGNRMYEKTFTFSKNTVKEDAAVKLPVIPAKGILAN
ncbi:hypothetical protein FHG64_09015 [Antarcticibacterium flavum]|uniref:Phenylalanyl-tRNA synthetase subunit alpha n=1 Tax=Antarcticibacterium flavum TaxID=2058175 RepID=A0A5B7X2M7_9FLAO|nr:hypothetical protein [Antarcticibacterium flavum]MCM4159119.1 hypothetical protein [Antarcticibacterium sp. W02-3]QCY69520.1 hypothetical protein FHG64_09015 [Antarcticibacterium flavum]